MKWIILDRDGVINFESRAYIKSLDEFIFLEGSLEALVKLSKAGFNIAIATNQSGIARGYYTVETLNLIHQKLLDAVVIMGGKIAGIFYCPHHPDEHCECRKPKSGLFKQIAERFSIGLENIPAIGDSYRDLQAAWNVGAEGILVETGNGVDTLKAHAELKDKIKIFPNLLAVANYLILTQKIHQR